MANFNNIFTSISIFGSPLNKLIPRLLFSVPGSSYICTMRGLITFLSQRSLVFCPVSTGHGHIGRRSCSLLFMKIVRNIICRFIKTLNAMPVTKNRISNFSDREPQAVKVKSLCSVPCCHFHLGGWDKS